MNIHKKKKILIPIFIILIVSLIVGGIFLFSNSSNTNELSDSEKFAEEYTKVSNDNVFIYKTLSDINKILENGTGIVYLGFPECPWCQEYVKYLNDEAKRYGVEKIYYCNILNDRKDNNDEYKETVRLLKDYLQYDEEGNKKIYVPTVVSVNKGVITGFDDETAWDTKNYETPEEYWKNEDLAGLKAKLKTLFESTEKSYCTTDCNG